MSEFWKNQIFKKTALILGVTVLAGCVFYVGYQAGFVKGTNYPQNIFVQGVTNFDKSKEKDVDFGLFWQAWQMIKDKYVSASELKNQDLVYGAVNGLFNSLEDPNSTFFPPADAKKFGEDISGEFSGIGAEIGIRNDQLVIVAPLKGSPAERAGLKSGDKIIKINDDNTFDITVEDAVKKIRGEKETIVKLSILRNGWEAPREFSIKREIIQLPTLDWEMKEGSIVYLHLYNFYEKAPQAFYQAAIRTAINNPKGLILDLRDNPGGYLEVAVNLAGWFLEPGQIIVKEEFRSGDPQVFKATGSGLFKDIPIVILINQGSASASEILAGALKDNRGIKLVGKKSFGKGTVQELSDLSGGAMAKITIAHWVMPKGQLIDKNGITPDYEIDIKEQDAKENRDPQLEKAIEVLKEQIRVSPIQNFFNIKYQPQ